MAETDRRQKTEGGRKKKVYKSKKQKEMRRIKADGGCNGNKQGGDHIMLRFNVKIR